MPGRALNGAAHCNMGATLKFMRGPDSELDRPDAGTITAAGPYKIETDLKRKGTAHSSRALL